MKLRRLMFLLICIELAVSFTFHLASDISKINTSLSNQAALYTELLSEYCIAPMTFADTSATYEMIQKIGVVSNILAVSVYNSQKQLFAKFLQDSTIQIPSKSDAIEWPLSFVSPYFIKKHEIVYSDLLLGTVYVYISKYEIRKAIINNILWSVALSFILAIIGIILIEIFQRRISKPIISLLNTVSTVSNRKDYSVRIQTESNDEIGELSTRFNDMLHNIQLHQEEQLKAEEQYKKLNQELEKRVEKRTRQLQQSNSDLEAFAYSVSHDLRAPLRHIDGFTKLLETKITERNEQINHYFNKIHESSHNMQNLITQLLSYSRIGRQELFFASVNLNSIVSEVIQMYNLETEGRLITWNISNLPIVQGDAGLLKIAFDNLISNAIKYTSKQHVAIIDIGYTELEDEYVIYVKDNGVGFDQQYVNKLFGVFQRLHSDKEFQGTGIGLANVKRIVQKHGGTVYAQGKLNEGASFYIQLKKLKN